jgi:hypothetical protein
MDAVVVAAGVTAVDAFADFSFLSAPPFQILVICSQHTHTRILHREA